LKIQPAKNLPICLSFQQAWFLLDLSVEAIKPDKLCMKRIEAVVKRSALDDFHRCAQQLGIFGFDLSEERKLPNHQPPPSTSSESNSQTASRVKVDFAVLDEEVKPTIHAVLESVHPNSIAVFKFDQDTRPPASVQYGSLQKFKSLP
jgi:nitrogen regulatory protein PII